MATVATTVDVESRLQRELSTTEDTMYVDLLDDIESMMAEALGRTETWPPSSYDVPKSLRSLAVTVAIRVAQNPEGLLSKSEQLGQYSKTSRYPDPGEDAGTSTLLSDTEQRLVRRIVFGGSHSVTVGSMLDDLPEQPTPVQFETTPLDVEDSDS